MVKKTFWKIKKVTSENYHLEQIVLSYKPFTPKLLPRTAQLLIHVQSIIDYTFYSIISITD